MIERKNCVKCKEKNKKNILYLAIVQKNTQKAMYTLSSKVMKHNDNKENIVHQERYYWTSLQLFGWRVFCASNNIH